jgi:hypothetical protein
MSRLSSVSARIAEYPLCADSVEKHPVAAEGNR